MAERLDEKLLSLLHSFDTVMLLTWDHDGRLAARPMVVAGTENAAFWFATSRSSFKVYQVKDQGRALIIAENDNSTYVVAQGIASIDYDRITIEKFWSEPLRVWFPKGKDDPDLVFIRVDVTEGEYWDRSGFQKLQYVFEAFKAYATGTTPEISEGSQHGKVVLEDIPVTARVD